LTALIYNVSYAEQSPTIEVYKSFLLTARSLLSDLKGYVKERELIEIINARIATAV
jgi:hypothetical protein